VPTPAWWQLRLFWNWCCAATVAIGGPFFGKMQLAIHQRCTLVACIAKKDANMAVLDAPSCAGVLALDPNRMLALLQKTRLIGGLLNSSST